MITITPYELEEDRGTIRQTRKTVIRVGVEPPPECRQFEKLAEMDNYRHLRGLVPQRDLVVVTPDGEVDEAATEEAIEANYATHYAHLESIAVDWTVGMKLTRKQPVPVRHNGKLYDVETGHTVVDPNHTPAVVPSLYVLIPAPAASGYPVWYQPAGAHDAWAKGSRCEWPEGGQVWESTIAANTTEPGTLLPWNYWIKAE